MSLLLESLLGSDALCEESLLSDEESEDDESDDEWLLDESELLDEDSEEDDELPDPLLDDELPEDELLLESEEEDELLDEDDAGDETLLDDELPLVELDPELDDELLLDDGELLEADDMLDELELLMLELLDEPLLLDELPDDEDERDDDELLDDESLLDEKFIAIADQAHHYTRLLAKREGLLVGMSSGAAMHAAVELAERIDSGTIVVLYPDRGEKYLSTPLFDVPAETPAIAPSQHLAFLPYLATEGVCDRGYRVDSASTSIKSWTPTSTGGLDPSCGDRVLIRTI